MSWCEDNGLSYIFGLAGTNPLAGKVETEADVIRTERAVEDQDVVRGFAETQAPCRVLGRGDRRVVARIEATQGGARSPLRRHHQSNNRYRPNGFMTACIARGDRRKT